MRVFHLFQIIPSCKPELMSCCYVEVKYRCKAGNRNLLARKVDFCSHFLACSYLLSYPACSFGGIRSLQTTFPRLPFQQTSGTHLPKGSSMEDWYMLLRSRVFLMLLTVYLVSLGGCQKPQFPEALVIPTGVAVRYEPLVVATVSCCGLQ